MSEPWEEGLRCRKQSSSPTLGPVVLLHCRCSVWPCATLWQVRRCGECGVQPQPIPEWESAGK